MLPNDQFIYISSLLNICLNEQLINDYVENVL